MVALVGALACSAPAAEERGAAQASAPAPDPALAERCARAIGHVSALVRGVGEMSPQEAAIVAAIDQASRGRCEGEGLSEAELACILAVDDPRALGALRGCPAIAARRPSWLVLPPSAEELAGIEAAMAPPAGPIRGPVAFTQLVSDGVTTCGLDPAGALACWGSRAILPEGTGFTKIGWGWHLCGLERGAHLRCAPASRGDDLAALPGDALVDFAEGPRHGCGIRAADGGLTCWSEDPEDAIAPPEGAYVEVVAGVGYACARTAAGEVRCFGRGAPGPVPPGRYSALAGGLFAACGLVEGGRVQCWDTSRTHLAGATQRALRALSCGERHCCGAGLDDGALACWGETPTDEAPPTGRFVAVLASYRHSCAVSEGGETICWGENDAGQLGVPRRVGEHAWRSPIPVLPGR